MFVDANGVLGLLHNLLIFTQKYICTVWTLMASSSFRSIYWCSPKYFTDLCGRHWRPQAHTYFFDIHSNVLMLCVDANVVLQILHDSFLPTSGQKQPCQWHWYSSRSKQPPLTGKPFPLPDTPTGQILLDNPGLCHHLEGVIVSGACLPQHTLKNQCQSNSGQTLA